MYTLFLHHDESVRIKSFLDFVGFVGRIKSLHFLQWQGLIDFEMSSPKDIPANHLQSAQQEPYPKVSAKT